MEGPLRTRSRHPSESSSSLARSGGSGAFGGLIARGDRDLNGSGTRQRRPPSFWRRFDPADRRLRLCPPSGVLAGYKLAGSESVSVSS